MTHEKYDLGTNSDATTFTFTSTGTHGDINKAIIYQITDRDDVLNLCFGDRIDISGDEFKIDDTINSDNGDRDTIIATVARSAYTFTEQYPDKYVVFQGSTRSRTRLYRMAITKYYEELSETFHIFGLILDDGGQLVEHPFDANTNFDGFIIKRR